MLRILAVDDQLSARLIVKEIVESFADVACATAGSLAEARQVMTQHAFDACFVDLQLSEHDVSLSGLTLIAELAQREGPLALCITSRSRTDIMRQAMRAGAFDFIAKDELSEDALRPVIDRLRANKRSSGVAALLGDTPVMAQLRSAITRYAGCSESVLIEAETGTGKELVARALHREGPFVDINCAAIPETLSESTLFGHERGAFTGATDRFEGAFAAAAGGTLFLDEVSELSLGMQAKLLRVLETTTFRRVGGRSEERFTGRVVAAANRDLHSLVREGRFRQDLFYRLDVLRLRIAPLRERIEDLPLLIEHFAQRELFAPRHEAWRILRAYSWPGNVRELRNVVRRLMLEPLVTAIEVEAQLQPCASATPQSLIDQLLSSEIEDKLTWIEGALIKSAMRTAGGNKSEAARRLGVHRKALERRLRA